MSQVISVAIIGTGAAGLSAIRLLACDDNDNNNDESSTQFRVTAFERTTRIGGTWAYSDYVGKDEHGIPIHSSMYKSLRTNLPKDCMHFPDFPIAENLPTFITHKDVLAYLEDYATHFDLRKHIQFKTNVEHVKPVCKDNTKFPVMWEVTTANMTSRNDRQTENFDAVLVCNGQFSVPKIPEILGLKTFEGHLIHSHDYREPQIYTNKTVIVVGALSSGQDISIDICSVATKVYLCYNESRISTILPPNVELKPSIKLCEGRVIEFNDGSTKHVDVIVLCTGYKHDFTFLDESIGLKVEDSRVTPLFKHFVPIGFPSLGIAGIPRAVLFFPMFYMQIKFFRSILNGTCTLPSQKDMKMNEEEDYSEQIRNGKPHRYAHHLSERQFDYFDNLAELGHFQRLPRILKTLYLTCKHLREADVTTYRSHQYIIEDDDTLKVIKPA